MSKHYWAGALGFFLPLIVVYTIMSIVFPHGRDLENLVYALIGVLVGQFGTINENRNGGDK